MSRIDQAFKRLAGVNDEDTTPHTLHGASEGRSLLEHYPEEERVQEPAPVARPVAQPRKVVSERSLRAVAAVSTSTGPELTDAGGPLERKLVTSEAAAPAMVQRYRQLADALQGRQSADGLRTVIVTSARRDDGKTLTIVNLALTLSELVAKRVLLIDADLHHPSLHTVFKLPHQAGLCEFLRSERNDIPLVPITEHLSILPAGDPDADAIVALTSDRMEDLVEDLADQFDWVLLDTAPLELMSDPGLTAGLAGGVLFVIRAEITPRAHVHRAIARLDAARVVGIVLNGVTD